MKISPSTTSTLATIVCSSISAFLGAYLAATVAWRTEHSAEKPDVTAVRGTDLPISERMTGEIPPPDQESSKPARLPGSVQAAALDDDSPSDADPIRALVQEEIPDATAEEVDTWTEELRSMGIQAAREILRMRKAIGRPY